MRKHYHHHGLKIKHFIQGFNIESIDKQHIGVKHYGTKL